MHYKYDEHYLLRHILWQDHLKIIEYNVIPARITWSVLNMKEKKTLSIHTRLGG